MTADETKLREHIRQAMLEALGIDIDSPDDSDEPGFSLPKDKNYTHALQKELFARWKNVDEREQEILVFRYGLANGESHSENETAELYGITGKEVRQIEFKVFGHRRRGYNAYMLREYICQLRLKEEEKRGREWKYQW